MNVSVGDVLQVRYDLLMVAASYVVSVLGSYAALSHARYMFKRDGTIAWPMAIGAAVALGGIGIWTMHFMGMMGYRLPLRVVYDGPLTVLSLVAAVLIAGVSLVLTGGRGRFSWPGWAAGSVLAAAGVCVMHYMGMYAMNLRAEMFLDAPKVAASAAIAVSAAAAALWLAFNVTTTTHRWAAALTMGVAVCAMHYTGMSAARFVCIAAQPLPLWSVGGDNLPTLVFAVSGLVLVLLCWNILGMANSPDGRRAARNGAGVRTAPAGHSGSARVAATSRAELHARARAFESTLNGDSALGNTQPGQLAA
jgi:NO-binding membrane sensor protein with MHYT domain